MCPNAWGGLGLDNSLFPEELGVIPIAESNCRDAGSFVPEFCIVFAQLRDVLAAEDSAITLIGAFA